MTGLSVGVDLGGTFAKIGLVDARGRILRSARLDTQVSAGPQAFVARVCAALADWRFDGLGLGLAGGVDAATGTLLFAPNLPGWKGFSFRSAFERRLRVPVVAENDANVAVWGGYVIGLKKKPRRVVGVTLGTGVGGGLILDGRLYRGATGAAGELGHQVIRAGGTRCGCGRRGCLEAYAGTAAILRAAKRLMRRPPVPTTPKSVADAAAAGDAGARRVWDEVGTALGEGLANMVLMFNPDAVLIVGGVARAGRLLLDPVRRVFSAQTFREPFSRLTLSAPAERDWGCVGAALLSREAR
ncbi:MAG: ROK family protein [Elusimicrobia bacterium]|nr:ROK family protein [Elusimicrobiota bacterium]